MQNDLLVEVGEKLNKVMLDNGCKMNADDTYLTSVVVNDQGKQVVSSSESLSWAIMEKVQVDELPDFSDEYAGLFSERWTFDPIYKVVGLDIDQVNEFGRAVVETYRQK